MAAPVRQEMKRIKQLVSTNGYTYRASVPASRPATDYTVRLTTPRWRGGSSGRRSHFCGSSTIRFQAHERAVNATQKLHELGQSLWLDNISRSLLTSGTLRRYIQEFSVSGLTSNPTIFDHALKNSHAYDDAIRQEMQEGKSGEALFFELALEDLRQAADLFRPIHDQTDGVDGWVSLGSLSPARPRHGRHACRSQGPGHARGGTAQSLYQDTGYPRGRPRHRGGHLRGRAGQRDSAVLSRTIRGRR